MRFLCLLIPAFAFCFESTDYFVGYQFSHVDLHSIKSRVSKDGNIHGITFGYLFQKPKSPFLQLQITFSKGSVFGADFNRRDEKLHYLQIDNQNVFGWNVLRNKLALVPYLGIGLFVKSEIPFSPMDYCSLVYSLFIPFGLRVGYDFRKNFIAIFDIQTQLKLYGRWFIVGHPLFTADLSKLSYRDVINLQLYLIWKITKKHALAIAPFYKHLKIQQKHEMTFFDQQRIEQWGFTLLYYFHF